MSDPKKVMHRAYSVLEVKSVDEDKRIVEGIATTPAVDRMNDVVVSEGLEFALPFPFLYQHNARQPIGLVTEAKVDSSGMRIKAQMAPASTAVYIDEAWALISRRCEQPRDNRSPGADRPAHPPDALCL